MSRPEVYIWMGRQFILLLAFLRSWLHLYEPHFLWSRLQIAVAFSCVELSRMKHHFKTQERFIPE